MSYSVVPASIRHVRPMSRRMRAAGSAALETFGLDPRAGLHRAFMASFYCRTALVDEKPVAMWGAAGVMLGSAAYVWLVISTEAEHMPRAVLKEARAELSAVAEGYDISATVLPHDAASVRFARHLGFGGNGDDDPLTDENYRVPLGDSFAVRMIYRHEAGVN